eukprot:CAMPEP_0113604000 /NCGR_PEP_ID=MMETSP0017_2-20120614/1568_1 /TAXON_ID=2856 /ORGANISM="Cylindrotheca closterium" /LENGTH=562 /DNA_ID=CAMNT_0000512409 /DNA_START=177 /DNA_END=1865 /DNA_ORIENTATION=- /assembly_acc=CAM_ASM_000147
MPPQHQDAIAARSSDDSSLVLAEGEEESSTQQRGRSSFLFSTAQQMDPNLPPPSRSMRRESFIVQFAKTKGPPQITIIMMLVAIGLGSTIGVVPAVMSDRFARLNHGYTGIESCAALSVDERPAACFAGSSDAQNAAAEASLVMNVLTFLTSSLIGSLSDEHGRKAILTIGLFISMLSPLSLYVIQLVPTMNPWWYYGIHITTGFVNWVAVALSSLNDVLPQKFRAPGLGLFLAGFMLGFSLAPIFSIFLSHLHLALTSFIMAFFGFLCTIFIVPETLPPHVAAEARRRRSELYSNNNNEATAISFPQRVQNNIKWLIVRPIRELSILNRNTFFRLISLLAFFSGMVSSGDQLLLVYYLEEQLDFTNKDVATMFLIIGIMGMMAQAIVLKPLNEWIGERLVVALCFFIGAVDNTMYGIATNKGTIFAAVALSAFTGMAFPTISAIKSNNVDASEQGRIQGALYSLQALASGVGPVTLRYVSSITKDSPLGPGSMFVFAGGLYLCAVAAALALPKELANSRRDHDEDVAGEEDYMPLYEASSLVEGVSNNEDSVRTNSSYGST